LVENKDCGSTIGLNPELDIINDLIKNAGPMLNEMTKNLQQSKHFRNRIKSNNNKQILD
jgi:hypothetical protein